MELYACDTCNHVDYLEHGQTLAVGQALCSKCKTGDWHGMFEYEPYSPSKHPNVVNRSSGFDPTHGNVSFS